MTETDTVHEQQHNPDRIGFPIRSGLQAPQDVNPAGLVSYENANAKESETISYMKKYQESAFSIRLGLKFSSQ